MDIAEAIKQLKPSEADWQQMVALSQQWGMIEMTGPVLRVCQEFLETQVPAWVMASLSVGSAGPITRFAMTKNG
ncbi:MAG: hypothetical protein IPL78_36115 [Chloroflexi bacterium]|nr:hypothetical protein [Chloroflexota bacterium]